MAAWGFSDSSRRRPRSVRRSTASHAEDPRQGSPRAPWALRAATGEPAAASPLLRYQVFSRGSLTSQAVLAAPAARPWRAGGRERMAGTLIHRPDGYTLDAADLAEALGLGAGTAHHSPVCRTLRRLAVFGLARFDDESTYAVRRHIPPASYSQLRRLGPELQRLHTTLLARHDTERLARRAQAMRRGA